MMVRTCLMYCINFFRNQLWQHLIFYNSFRITNMCLLKVAMCEKRRNSHLQPEGGSKKFNEWGVEGGGGRVVGGLKDFRTGGLPIQGGVSTPLHAMVMFPEKLWDYKRFSILKLQDRLMKSSYAKRRQNSSYSLKIISSSYLTLQNIKFHFELPTRQLNFYFSTFESLIRS